jgi:hypothetical protein
VSIGLFSESSTYYPEFSNRFQDPTESGGRNGHPLKKQKTPEHLSGRSGVFCIFDYFFRSNKAYDWVESPEPEPEGCSEVVSLSFPPQASTFEVVNTIPPSAIPSVIANANSTFFILPYLLPF